MKPVSIASFAENLIVSGGRLVHVHRIVSQVRDRFPRCDHTDDELGQLVAVIAVSKGKDLAFVKPPAEAV